MQGGRGYDSPRSSYGHDGGGSEVGGAGVEDRDTRTRHPSHPYRPSPGLGPVGGGGGKGERPGTGVSSPVPPSTSLNPHHLGGSSTAYIDGRERGAPVPAPGSYLRYGGGGQDTVTHMTHARAGGAGIGGMGGSAQTSRRPSDSNASVRDIASSIGRAPVGVAALPSVHIHSGGGGQGSRTITSGTPSGSGGMGVPSLGESMALVSTSMLLPMHA
jgi:hypothetical protein